VIVVAFGTPYILRQFPDVAGFVCAYGADLFSQRAAAKALTGAIEYAGKLPVDREPQSTLWVCVHVLRAAQTRVL
jgi:hypothetical protein